MSSPLKSGRSEWRECADRDEAGVALDGSRETVLTFSPQVAQIAAGEKHFNFSIVRLDPVLRHMWK